MCEINILQYNVRGIISSDIQQMKCRYIYQQLMSKRIDVVLLQEWCATVRENVDDESISTTDNRHHSIPHFPIELFPGYNVHYTSTECAILYQEDLSVTPVPFDEEYYCYPHRHNFHICGIILHTKNSDIEIYSTYRPQSADPLQLFDFPFKSDHIIVAGDFNLHHPLWGSANSSSKSDQFVNHLNESQFQLLNSKTPTRCDPSDKNSSCIDLTLITPNIHKREWFVNQAAYRRCVSDHFEIYFTVSLEESEDDIYHSTWILGSNSKWRKFRNELQKRLINYSHSRPNNTAGQFIQISNIIYNTAVHTIGFRKCRRGFKPWWNPSINRLKKKCKQLRRKLEKLRKKFPFYYKSHPKYLQLKLEYDDYQKLKSHTIHHAKRKYNDKINDHLQSSDLDDKYGIIKPA